MQNLISIFNKTKILLNSRANPFIFSPVLSAISLLAIFFCFSQSFLQSIGYTQNVTLSLLSPNPCYSNVHEYKRCISNIFNPVEYSNHLAQLTNSSLSKVSVDKEILSLIGDNTVDTYPWELSEIEKHHLNWKSRPTFQSYISYTPWIDLQNNAFWNSVDKPKFILWNTEFGIESIDNRYIFNDEPISIFGILASYKPVIQKNPHILLRLRNNPLTLNRTPKPAFEEKLEISSGKFNEEIPVPIVDKDCILRVKIDFKYSIKGHLKNFLYKSDAQGILFNINGSEKKFFRLVPKNSISGIWINPLITKLDVDTLDIENILKMEHKVKSFMLMTEDKKMFKGFRYQWEQICKKL